MQHCWRASTIKGACSRGIVKEWVQSWNRGALSTLAGGFVIDEEGLGYDDIGEEFDWGKADEENTEGNEPKQGGGKAAPHKGARTEGCKADIWGRICCRGLAVVLSLLNRRCGQ